jgi:hypothetical protein
MGKPPMSEASLHTQLGLCAHFRGGKTHYAASLMSAADQQIPDASVVLEDSITETRR